MTYAVPAFARSLIERWWYAIRDRVDDLLDRYSPAGGQPVLRLTRVEASAVSTALDIFEALMRRILVIMCAELGPAPAPPGLGRPLFRIEETPPEPVIRQTAAEAPDWCLKPLPERTPRSFRQETDGLVSAARILKRLRALADIFENGQLYLDAMCARLTAHLPPLPDALPKAFTVRSITPVFAADLKDIHAVALEAQACNTS